MLNQYSSTYQKDYIWPYVSGVRQSQPSTVKDALCVCIESRLKEPLDLSQKSCDWSRTGPMGRLLEPKLYPTKVQLVSETDATPFDQTRIFLQKLEEQCPEFQILKKALPVETSAQIDADHMKTTYQVHYSDPAAERMIQRDKALALAEMDGQKLQYQIPIKITIETDCPPHCHPSPSRYDQIMKTKKTISKRKNGIPKCGRKKDEQKQLLPWKSEYQDSISKIGQIIVRSKLHQTKKNTVPTWVTSN